MTRTFSPPSPALVIACIALVVALGPTVRAAALVTTADIENGAVTTPKLADEAVTDVKLAPGSVTAGKLAANAITTTAILDGSVSLAKIRGADVKLTVTVAAGAIPNGRCSPQTYPVAGAKVGEVVLISPLGQVPLQAGVFIHGTQVVSAGHVAAVICNMSGTTQSAISKTVRVVTLG